MDLDRLGSIGINWDGFRGGGEGRGGCGRDREGKRWREKECECHLTG